MLVDAGTGKVPDGQLEVRSVTIEYARPTHSERAAAHIIKTQCWALHFEFRMRRIALTIITSSLVATMIACRIISELYLSINL